MNFKKTATLLSFLMLFVSKMYSQVLFQAYLITDEDTLTMWTTFINDALLREIKITSDRREMSHSTCLSGGYKPTWKIENDSIFLIELIDDTDRDSLQIIDLQKAFKENYINGRVFGKGINYQIEASYLWGNHYDESNSDIQVCFTIKNGKIIDSGRFKDKTRYADEAAYLSAEAIVKNTNWAQLPDISVERQVTIKITTDDDGKILSAEPIKNSDMYGTIKPEGEEVWKQEALRQVKLIPKWHTRYKCGQVVDKEDILIFLFDKPK